MERVPQRSRVRRRGRRSLDGQVRGIVVEVSHEGGAVRRLDREVGRSVDVRSARVRPHLLKRIRTARDGRARFGTADVVRVVVRVALVVGELRPHRAGVVQATVQPGRGAITHRTGHVDDERNVAGAVHGHGAGAGRHRVHAPDLHEERGLRHGDDHFHRRPRTRRDARRVRHGEGLVRRVVVVLPRSHGLDFAVRVRGVDVVVLEHGRPGLSDGRYAVVVRHAGFVVERSGAGERPSPSPRPEPRTRTRR